MMKLDLAWVRTALAALAFIWLMVAWHLYDERARVDWARRNALIATLCSAEGDADSRAHCEFGLRMTGDGVNVSGSVDVSGSGDVSQ